MKKKFLSIALVILGLMVLSSCADAAMNPDEIVAEAILVDTPYTTLTIASYGTNFYSFVPSLSGIHDIALTNTGSDLSWTLFTNPSFINPGAIDDCDEFMGSTGDEIDPTPYLNAGTRYYLAVDEWDDLGPSYFDLLITGP